jgi:hypothetical protein
VSEPEGKSGIVSLKRNFARTKWKRVAEVTVLNLTPRPTALTLKRRPSPNAFERARGDQDLVQLISHLGQYGENLGRIG